MGTRRDASDGLTTHNRVFLDHSHNILDHAQRCWQTFSRGQLILPGDVLSTKHSAIAALDFKSDFEQFRVWTKSLGVFAPDALSVDYRLRDAEEVRRSICTLLDSICSNILQCIEIVESSKARLQQPVDEKGIDESDSIDSSGSDLSEDDDNDSNNGGGTRTSHLAPKLRYLLENNSDLVEKLLRISIAIRKSGLKARNLRADAWQDKNNNDTDKDLFGPSLSLILEKRYGLSDPLKTRICLALSRQRHRILYAKAHRENLSYIKEQGRPDVQRTVVSPDHLQPQHLPSVKQAAIKEQGPSTQSQITRLTDRTEATKYTKINLEQMTQRSVAAGSTVSSRSYAQKATIPQAPSVQSGLRYFECPYCCLLLPREKADSKNEWRKHVISDLCPFVCVNDTCTAATVQFEKEAEWFEHHRKYHAQEWWCDGSSPPHEPQVFDTVGSFVEHMRTLHTASYSDTQIQKLIHMQATTKEDPFEACPFCDATSPNPSPQSQINVVVHQWRSHIANHLIDLFATFALPQRDDLDDQLSNQISNAPDRSTLGQLDDSIYGDNLLQPGGVTIEFEALEEDSPGDRGEFMHQWNFIPKPQFNGADLILTAFMDNRMQDMGTEISSDHLPAWLRQDAALDDYVAARDQRAPGTGEWLLNDEQFQKWFHETGSSMSLHGTMGCGKTVLCATIVEHILRSTPDTSNTMVCYFFFMYTDIRKRTLGSALQSLLSQLVGHPSALSNVYPEELAKLGGSELPPSSAVMQRLLEVVLKDGHRTYIMLDGLDQCSDQEDLTRCIHTLAGYTNVHFLCTTRRDINPFDDQIWFMKYNVELMAGSIISDICTYMDSRILACREKEKRIAKPEFANILEQVVKESLDMFEYASRYMEDFEQCSSEREIMHVESALPSGLCSKYNQELRRLIQTHGEEESIRTLQWLAYARTPMSLLELREISRAGRFRSVRGDASHSPKPDAILDHSPGLFRLIDSPRNSTRDASQYRAQIAHDSVKTYLLSQQCPYRDAFDLQHCELLLAKSCLEYLLLLSGKAPLSESILLGYHFYCYAAKHWWRHASNVDELDLYTTNLATELFTNKTAFSTWLQLYDPDEDAVFFRDVQTAPLTPWYCAALIGSRIAFDSVWSSNVDVNARNQPGKYGNLLQAAVFGNNASIVSTLISAGADIEISGGYFGSAIQAASYGGNPDIVSALIDAGADVNTQGGPYGSAIRAASYGGNPDTVSALIDAGADVNTQDGRHGSALQAASRQGQTIIVSMLVAAGADVNAQNADRESALYMASRRGYTEVVSMLIAAGADVNAQNTVGESALYIASCNGHAEVVSRLIAAGADVNAQDTDRESALHIASRNGHLKVASTLIAAGADVNAQDTNGKSALHIASSFGTVDGVRLLIQHRADMNAQDEASQTALHRAARSGFDKIAALLLDHGAILETRDFKQRTALQIACYEGNEAVVKVFLDHGADVNAPAGDYGDALESAAEKGHMDVVEMVLDAGAKVLPGGRHARVLLEAIENGHEQVVLRLLKAGVAVDPERDYGEELITACTYGNETILEILLKMGANCNARNQDGWSAVMVASSRKRYAILQALLGAGANVNTWSDTGTTALVIASALGNDAIVRLLLDAGADPNVRNHFRESALEQAALHRHEGVLKLLLRDGAAVLGDVFDETMTVSCTKGHTEIVKLLLSAVTPDTAVIHGKAMSEAVAQGYADIVRMLLEAVADADTQYDLTSCLVLACENGQAEVVRVLLDAGVRLRNRQEQQYLLDVVRLVGSEDTERALLDAGWEP